MVKPVTSVEREGCKVVIHCSTEQIAKDTEKQLRKVFKLPTWLLKKAVEKSKVLDEAKK